MGREGVKQPAIYMMASGRGGTLYVGVTSDLVRPVWQHREGIGGGFAARYGCRVLVWFELFGSMEGAIAREKELKGWVRSRKVGLIEEGNGYWEDLWGRIVGEGSGEESK